jgi:hypothetical protein
MSDMRRIVVEKENIVEHFNTRRREEYWANKKVESKKKKFISYLKHAKEVLIDDEMIYDTNGVRLIDSEQDEYSDTYFRLMIGYGIFGNKGIKSGIYTEDSISFKKKTDDHLLGAWKIGETAFIAYCNSGFDNEYMKNVWLYENLYFWMSITVSNKEHNENILRNKNTIEEKLQFKHYDGVSSLLFNLKEIVYYKIDIQKAMNGMPKSKLKESRINFLSNLSGDTVVKDNDNKDILKYFLDKGLAVKYSEYV